ncbi:hypothetical protein [Zavarzinia sp. CC-PAN008]|uniref:hypothetical protein n=1 Tax=Zavarzinia sp. CC-PAN008 TaxID=3243332 RepID=UPI003F746165
MGERFVIIGAGISGLGTVLALSKDKGDRSITLLEQDGPPPAGDADTVFQEWTHRGVAQLRHSHVFLARLHNLLRDHYPALYADLIAAGARPLLFKDSLPDTLRDSYVPEAGDDDMTILSCRRTTLECVIRRHVEAHNLATIRPDARVADLLATPGRTVAVRGVRLETGEEIPADVVIDASGRRSQFTDMLRSLGAVIDEETTETGIVYYTRHYKLRPGMGEPERGKGPPGAGDLGYIKYGIFPADNDCFSLTLALPDNEAELRRAMPNADMFQATAMAIPGVARWCEPERSEATSRVYVMGDLRCRYLNFAVDGTPAATGFFAVGDASLFGNPMYGRGCSQGFMHAHVLDRVLRAEADPAARAKAFQAATDAELKPYHILGVKQDQAAIRKSEEVEGTAPRKRSLKARLARSFTEDGIIPASRASLVVLRNVSQSFHMLETPELAFKRPAVLGRILYYWARGKKLNAKYYPPVLGPKRMEMRRILGIAA